MPTATEHRWPCSQCGAQLRFQPGQTRLVCAHCGHVQEIPAAADSSLEDALRELPLAEGLRDDLPREAMETVRTTRCTSCGAMIEFEGAEHARQCPFCATPVVVGTGQTRMIKPQALVAFTYDERRAREQLVKWLGSLWFAPSKLLDYTRRGRAMTGVYAPMWTFDAATRSWYQGQRGDAYYETQTITVMVDGKPQRQQQQVRKIRWSPASGEVARDFDDVLVIGSNSLPRGLAQGLGPWDLGELAPFSADYLAGFTAEGYTVPLAQAEVDAKAQMARQIEMDVRRDIGGDEQRINRVETRHDDETFKHVLLPIWTAAYKYNGKSYRFLVNGQTGKVQGERPWSIWKIAFAVLAALIVLVLFSVVADKGGFLR